MRSHHPLTRPATNIDDIKKTTEKATTLEAIKEPILASYKKLQPLDMLNLMVKL
jgi:hypothetical protein